MSFLELALLLDKTQDGFNSILPIVSLHLVFDKVTFSNKLLNFISNWREVRTTL